MVEATVEDGPGTGAEGGEEVVTEAILWARQWELSQPKALWGRQLPLSRPKSEEVEGYAGTGAKRAVRKFIPCDNGRCDWNEINPGLAVRRWYATNQILPDGRAIIVGGRRQFNYEFYPKSDFTSSKPISLRLLVKTRDKEENNLYPFVHLNVDGNLFIFSNNRAILLDYKKNVVVRSYPVLTNGEPRNYPSSGSSVLLPLNPSGSEAEVLVCGGAPKGSFNNAQTQKTYFGALNTCGRIKITDKSPSWSTETMPMARVMGDMLLLPNGQVLIINGAGAGTAGWENAREPVLRPVIYNPDASPGARFHVQSSSRTPRLYHSSAIVLRDGRVLVGGSNPHIYYNFTGVRYPTELSLESFSPGYLDSGVSGYRPVILSSMSPLNLSYNNKFSLRFTMKVLSDVITVTMLAPSFTTHSFSMNQRLLVLRTTNVTVTVTGSGSKVYEIGVTAPLTSALAPPGYYMVFVVNEGIPSEGIWVHIQ
ncbi:aldehyde oxidase GLOX1-like [Asparagus officinalis]|uniref:aldehyde oxidase GLOX1-like n=1 Tax=Asparagus officinalis TaxID=4686 RepID=UPI00098DF58F|nr:aldehyde oxidase GLOX1-like [Asparagus officinalis]